MTDKGAAVVAGPNSTLSPGEGTRLVPGPAQVPTAAGPKRPQGARVGKIIRALRMSPQSGEKRVVTVSTGDRRLDPLTPPHGAGSAALPAPRSFSVRN